MSSAPVYNGKYFLTWNHDYGDPYVLETPMDIDGPYDTIQEAHDAAMVLARDIAISDGDDYQTRFRIIQMVHEIDVDVNAALFYATSLEVVK